MYFYYEVYEPQTPAGGSALLKTSLAFYRGTVKVFETPVVERSDLDAVDRRAALFQFEVPADAFRPGLYTCQVNIIDDVAGSICVSSTGTLRALRSSASRLIQLEHAVHFYPLQSKRARGEVDQRP